MTQDELETKLNPTNELEEEQMGQLVRQCPECAILSSPHAGEVLTFEVSRNADLHGVATCRFHPSIKMPIEFRGGYADSTASSLPVHESKKLRKVPKDMVQDVEEAEDCHFNKIYKAASVMCRRVLQLAYEHYLSEELMNPEWTGKLPTLGPLIGIARALPADKQLRDLTIRLSERINEIGNDGAHHRVILDPSDVATAIHDTVVVANEVYRKKPVPQSELGSNEQ